MNVIHLEPPENFHPKFEVTSCICWFEDTFLCLQRNANKREGGKWGFPGGKVDKDESLEQALRRELYEETIIRLNAVNHLQKFYVRYPEIDYIFHLFETKFNNLPKIILKEDENVSYDWYTIEQFLEKDVVLGNDEIIKLLYFSK